jgi:8-oxo-dGTP pyrophosphatase MutT (NUDIX family)
VNSCRRDLRHLPSDWPTKAGHLPKTASEISAPRLRQVAALPWRQENDGTISVLLVTSRTNKKWILPKGWGMHGKTDAETAQQEALEEAGIEGVMSSSPVGSYAYIKLFDDGSTKAAQAIVFSMLVTRQFRKWPERGQRRRKWVTAEQAAAMVFERGLSRFLTGLAAGRIIVQTNQRP